MSVCQSVRRQYQTPLYRDSFAMTPRRPGRLHRPRARGPQTSGPAQGQENSSLDQIQQPQKKRDDLSRASSRNYN